MAHAFDSIRLGDVLVLPGGEERTARAKVVLTIPVGPLHAFVVCDELQALLVLEDGVMLGMYRRVKLGREQLKNARSVSSGSCSYWSPHLPAKRQAMGELRWRVVERAGQIHPIVMLYRSNEPVCFTRSEGFDMGSLRVLALPKGNEDTSRVERVAARVVHPDRELLVPELEPARRTRRRVRIGVR